MLKEIPMTRPIPAKTQRLASLVLGVSTALALTACGAGGTGSASGGSQNASTGNDNGSSPIVIGVVNPLQGDTAEGAQQLNNGYKLAVQEANHKGGVDGHKIKLQFANAATASEGQTAAQQLITKDNAEILVGTFVSAVSNTASQTAARYKVPYWDTNALANKLTKRGLKNFFRVGMNSTYFGKSIKSAIPLFEQCTGKDIKNIKIYFDHENSIYGTSVSKAQVAALRAAGATVIANDPYNPQSANFANVALRVKHARPDVWAFMGYTQDSIELLNAAKQQDFRPAAIFGGTGGRALLKGVGQKYLNGVLSTDYPHDVNSSFGPGSHKFVKHYKQQYGRKPELPQAMTAYTGMEVLLRVLKKTDGDASLNKFAKAAMSLDVPRNSLPTGSGVKFNDNHQNTRVATVIDQWQNGVLTTVAPKKAVEKGTSFDPHC
jgi:branched-chain amino acid transport system substrate-binding protein